MTQVAAERLPELGEQRLTVVVFGTVVFEEAGPILTRLTLQRSGECGSV